MSHDAVDQARREVKKELAILEDMNRAERREVMRSKRYPSEVIGRVRGKGKRRRGQRR